jgi:hypothetical protein
MIALGGLNLEKAARDKSPDKLKERVRAQLEVRQNSANSQVSRACPLRATTTSHSLA